MQLLLVCHLNAHAQLRVSQVKQSLWDRGHEVVFETLTSNPSQALQVCLQQPTAGRSAAGQAVVAGHGRRKLQNNKMKLESTADWPCVAENHQRTSHQAGRKLQSGQLAGM